MGVGPYIGQSTCKWLCMFPAKRKGVLEWSQDTLQEPYHDIYLQEQKQQEEEDGPEDRPRNERHGFNEGQECKVWALLNLLRGEKSGVSVLLLNNNTDKDILFSLENFLKALGL